MFARSPLALFLAFGSAMVHAQTLPCPPVPELAHVVDTQDKCNCFYAMAGSGLDIGDETTYEPAFNDDTEFNFGPTGTYYGPEGIAEYLSSVEGGEFITTYEQVGTPLILDMSGTTAGQCVVTTAERRRTIANSAYTENNVEVCADLLAGYTIFYTLTGNDEAPVSVSTINAYYPDGYVRSNHDIWGESRATAEYVCDVIVNKCPSKKSSKKGKASKNMGMGMSKSMKMSKSTKASKRKLSKKSKISDMDRCLRRYNRLPSYDEIDGAAYFDGDSKGCRNLHAIFAATNPFHCPHVSFAPDKDDKGVIKCHESQGISVADIFPQEILDAFLGASFMLGLGPEGYLSVEGGGCPPL